RALVHTGAPGYTLYVQNVTIANGRYVNPNTAGSGGGCIYSSGDVELEGVEVTSCYTTAAKAISFGGAVQAKGAVKLVASTVTKSTALGTANSKYASARGGGISADSVNLYLSAVSGNTASAPNNTTYGGGIYANHVFAKYSTVSGNSATSRAGISASGSL